jgi:hypothetical protein
MAKSVRRDAGEGACGVLLAPGRRWASLPWMKFASPIRRLPRNPLILHPTADCPLPTDVFFLPASPRAGIIIPQLASGNGRTTGRPGKCGAGRQPANGGGLGRPVAGIVRCWFERTFGRWTVQDQRRRGATAAPPSLRLAKARHRVPPPELFDNGQTAFAGRGDDEARRPVQAQTGEWRRLENGKDPASRPGPARRWNDRRQAAFLAFGLATEFAIAVRSSSVLDSSCSVSSSSLAASFMPSVSAQRLSVP